MSHKKKLIMGTFILTITGLLSRFLGFGQRILLNQVFGAEGVGIYQLVFPIYALFVSLTSSGIQTCISRSVASKTATGDESGAKKFLITSITLSLLLSLIGSMILNLNSYKISTYLLADQRTNDLLKLLAYTLPFSSIQSCVVGYYLGKKETTMPCACQLFEQIVRIGSLYLMYSFGIKNGTTLNISFSIICLLFAEFLTACITLILITGRKVQLNKTTVKASEHIANLKELLPIAFPLTANKATISLLHSIEAISIPKQLLLFGLSRLEALSNYGVLVGMALPCILFPTAITTSMSTMLLPTVAEMQALDRKKEIKTLVNKTVQICTILGISCLISFLLFANVIGEVLFHNPLASSYIRIMAWLCPFLYLNTTLLSILNGLGKTKTTFLLNTFSLIIRILFVFVFIPQHGINGYLWGLLFSQIFLTVFSFIKLHFLCLV